MARLFSYVVDHDLGFAPNPDGGYCSLAHCKFGTKRANIVELAKIYDWIAGTGGVNLDLSAGHGRLIYAMRVTEKMTLEQYARDPRFSGRADNLPDYAENRSRFVLISDDFYYFGRKAVPIADIPSTHLGGIAFEKKGSGHKGKSFSEAFIADFESWLRRNFIPGRIGPPCGGHN